MNSVDTDTSLATLVAVAGSTADGDVLAAAVKNGPLGRFGADRVAIYVADADGTALRMAGHSGGDEVRHLYGTLPVDEGTPNGVVFRSGTELFLTLADAHEYYPLMAAAAALYDDRDNVELAFLPLRRAGAGIGVLGLLFSSPLPRDWETRAALDAVCSVVGLWCAAHHGTAVPQDSLPAPLLTARQRDVLRLAAEGLTNSRIAAQLGFAESTVKADLTQLYRLTGATSRGELIARTRTLTSAQE